MRQWRLAPFALIAACAGPAPEAPQIPEWAVGATPSLTIGAGEAEPGHELSRVSGARMQGGVIVVANTGSFELQRFDSAGKLLGYEGRKGNGPGEFTGILRLSAAPGDSFYVLDSENLRWSVHDGQGRYARTLPGGTRALASPVWPYHRTIVRGPAGQAVPAWALAVLDSVADPRKGSAARQAILDDLGFLWVRDSTTTSTWAIYANAERPVGRAQLPGGLALLQVGRDFVLGIERDTSDQELLRRYSLSRPERVAAPAMLPAGAIARPDSAVRDRLYAQINGILTAQEGFYSDHASYTGNADSLRITLPSDFDLALLSGDKRHWAGLVYHRTTHTSCAVSVGFTAEGWLDGTAFCGR